MLLHDLPLLVFEFCGLQHINFLAVQAIQTSELGKNLGFNIIKWFIPADNGEEGWAWGTWGFQSMCVWEDYWFSFFLSFCVNIANFAKAWNPLASQIAVTFLFAPGGGQALKKVLGQGCAVRAGCSSVNGWNVTVPVLMQCSAFLLSCVNCSKLVGIGNAYWIF